ncbi:MAG: glycerol acyltransferase [Robiginitomaculum sp.]|nr:MAG: glycerol acyltransferase [Robiginitomaculum sp.]
MLEPEKHLHENAPRLGNRFTRFIGRLIVRSMGYDIKGKFPDEDKLILIVAPHTSNWDLFLAIGTILSLGVRMNFMMKKEAFRFPVKSCFIRLGGIPIERGSPQKVVKRTLRSFQERDKLWLAILPEGTRKPVKSWKSGFVRIAYKADVPIFIMGLDHPNKLLILDKMVKASPDPLVQAEELRLYCKDKFSGMNPKNH